MAESHKRSPGRRFGSFAVDLQAGELHKDGTRVKLQQKAFQILAALLERPGEVVTREALRAKLWPADTFVEFDDSLNHAVQKLREALSDSAEQPRYIETLARRGYRFIAPLQPQPSDVAAQPATSVVRPIRLRHGLLAALAVVTVVGALVVSDVGGLRGWLKDRANPVRIEALAVLPLENLSGDPSQEYFADGITEQLTTDLAQIGSLRTISRTSAMRYKGAKKTLPEIARELNVDAVVEGAVVHSGDRVRITVQLIQARTDRHLWAHTYEGSFRDLAELQMEVARAIATELRVELTSQERARLARIRAVDPKAHELYLRGQYHYHKWKKEEFDKAIEYFQQATEADPKFAPAYVGLANSYGFLWIEGYLSLEKGYPVYAQALERALQLDDTLPEAHYAVAAAAFYLRWNWEEAEREFKRALELNPNLEEARYEYAWFLSAMGRNAEAVAEARRAVQIDPLSIPASLALGSMYHIAHQDADARAQLVQTAELEPNDSRAYEFLAGFAEQAGRYDEAIAFRRKAMALSGVADEDITAMVRAYQESGRKAYINWQLERSIPRAKNPCATAQWCVLLGDNDRALAFLEQAFKQHNWGMVGLTSHRIWDPVRSDARFRDLVRRVGLPQ